MNTYFSGRGCPKCGGKNTQDTHYPASTYHPTCGYPPVEHPERIVRRCYRCAYCWNEAPLDAGAIRAEEGKP